MELMKNCHKGCASLCQSIGRETNNKKSEHDSDSHVVNTKPPTARKYWIYAK